MASHTVSLFLHFVRDINYNARNIANHRQCLAIYGRLVAFTEEMNDFSDN